MVSPIKARPFVAPCGAIGASIGLGLEESGERGIRRLQVARERHSADAGRSTLHLALHVVRKGGSLRRFAHLGCAVPKRPGRPTYRERVGLAWPPNRQRDVADIAASALLCPMADWRDGDSFPLAVFANGDVGNPKLFGEFRPRLRPDRVVQSLTRQRDRHRFSQAFEEPQSLRRRFLRWAQARDNRM